MSPDEHADRLFRATCAFVRVALGTAFLSAVADRFGIWGSAGAANVAWGDYEHFLAYTAMLNAPLSGPAVVLIGALVTAAETLLGLLLLLGIRVPQTSAWSAILLFVFGVAMAVHVGPKAPLDYSVFTASAGALLLSRVSRVAATPRMMAGNVESIR